MITKPYYSTFSSGIFNFNGLPMKDLEQIFEYVLIDGTT